MDIDRRKLLQSGLAATALPLTSCAVPANAETADLTASGKLRWSAIASADGAVQMASEGDIAIITLVPARSGSLDAASELTVTIGAAPEFAEGVQLWRYEPWDAWTKPMAVANAQALQPDDVQLFYWHDRDGVFGAAVPLSGSGFRTTLGQVDGKLAARAAAGATNPIPKTLPMIAVGHGRDFHALVTATYRAALAAMGRSDSNSADKRLPQALTYLGWNSWNASDLGKNLTQDLMFDAARTLREAGVPVGWMTADDGYFDHREQRIRSFDPDPTKFPDGFPATIARLKSEFGVRYVGAWMALDGYWHGIDPQGPIGQRLAADLFTWTERTDRSNPASPERTNAFVRPDRPAMAAYYDAHVAALKAHGFDFLKVDNQLVVERMAKGNFPIWQLATAMHDGLNAAVKTHFDDAIINCMDLTADAYFNFGTTPVARAVEDYFPYKPDEDYNLEKGNAAAHVLQAIYNSIYVSQVAVPDYDMFESTNPNALVHAVARVANNGPIYITDQPGKHDIELVKAMALADGRTLRADAPLLPCTDCLFQLQGAAPFKAFSRNGDAGLLAIFNLADADRVTGRFQASDVPGLGNEEVVAFDHVAKRMMRIAPGDMVPIDLPRFGVQLWSLHVPANGIAAFGRSDKLNGAATLRAVRSAGTATEIDLAELGPLAAYCASRPVSVTVAGQSLSFEWSDGLLKVAAPMTGAPGTVRIVQA